MGIPENLRIVAGSYFRKRVSALTDLGPRSVRIRKGRNSLWNRIYDGIFGIIRPLVIELHCLADYVAITAVGKTIADWPDNCNAMNGVACHCLDSCPMLVIPETQPGNSWWR